MISVGLTYDLRSEYLSAGFSEEETCEFDREDTIAAIENALLNLNYTTERIGNARQLMNELIAGKRWDIVFNIAEGMYGTGREAQVPAILDNFNIPYTFSDTVVMALSLHKGLTKKIIRDSGIPTADFLIIEKYADILINHLPFPVFAKPVAEGTGKGIGSFSKISDKEELYKVTAQLLQKYKQPVLLEEFLPGREFTVGITGTGNNAESIGVLEVILKKDAEKEAYSYINKENCEELVIYRVAEDIDAKNCELIALNVWNCLGCRDGGRVDLKLDKNNNPCFLEVNPLAGLHPHHSDLPILANQKGIGYTELIKRIMDSACRRITKI
jgi:D-alanine-D-alanine ligase